VGGDQSPVGLEKKTESEVNPAAIRKEASQRKQGLGKFLEEEARVGVSNQVQRETDLLRRDALRRSKSKKRAIEH